MTRAYVTSKEKRLMFLFGFIVILWAVGIAWLVLWKSSPLHKQDVSTSEASYETEKYTPYTGGNSKSGFGELLK